MNTFELVSHPRGESLASVAIQKLGPLELEVAENPSDRLLALFLLDRSSSMAGRPIAELNQCFRQLVADLREDPFTSLTVDLGVIAFTDRAELELPPTAVRQLEPGQLTPLVADGNTALGESLEMAAGCVIGRLRHYRRVGLGAYRPCIFLLTDGCPTDEWQAQADHLRTLAENHRWSIFCIALGQANLDVLRRIAPAHLPPQVLRDDLPLKGLFSWVKESLSAYSKSQGASVNLPPIHPWAKP